MLPDPSPAPPPGKTQFQLTEFILFDLTAVAHKYFSFRYAPLYAGRLDKGCPTKNNSHFLFFFSFGRFSVK
jgi:hypothetical protein